MDINKDISKQHFPPSTTAYSKSCALCMAFSMDESQNKTITLEFARSDAPRRYDWSNKVGFLLSINEMADLCAFLTHPWTDTYGFIHSSSNSGKKTLSVKNQSSSFLFTLVYSSITYRIPVSPSSIYLFRNHLMSRLIELQPDLPPALHWRSLKQLSISHQSSGCIGN